MVSLVVMLMKTAGKLAWRRVIEDDKVHQDEEVINT